MSHDPTLYWTKVAAIGQVAGAIATVAAVVLSLWIVLSERRLRASARCSLKALFAGDGTPPTYLVAFDITNIGLRPLTVVTIGWRTGLFRRGPAWLRRQVAVQNAAGLPIGANPPFELPPGIAKSVFIPIAIFAQGPAQERQDFFCRRAPWNGKLINTPIYAIFSMTGRKDLHVRVDPALAEFLRTAQHHSLGNMPE